MHHAGGTRSAYSCAEHLERKTASEHEAEDSGVWRWGSFESGTKSESDARALKSRASRKFDGQASKSSAGVRFGLIWIRRAGIDSSRLEFGLQEWRCREFDEQHSAAQSTSGKNGRSELDVLLEARRKRSSMGWLGGVCAFWIWMDEGKKPRAEYVSLNVGCRGIHVKVHHCRDSGAALQEDRSKIKPRGEAGGWRGLGPAAGVYSGLSAPRRRERSESRDIYDDERMLDGSRWSRIRIGLNRESSKGAYARDVNQENLPLPFVHKWKKVVEFANIFRHSAKNV
ncbi:hypothetical protein DFH09DRAFT_1404506 [Mycena vulgaris]|nr:hypothetical protein DFH09DRAFT_1404506 [Mycena vulgaris]